LCPSLLPAVAIEVALQELVAIDKLSLQHDCRWTGNFRSLQEPAYKRAPGNLASSFARTLSSKLVEIVVPLLCGELGDVAVPNPLPELAGQGVGAHIE
jgi:hypothetical protein